MSERYIREHFDDIKRYASTIESRLDDADCTVESLLHDNREMLRRCRKSGSKMLMIDREYRVDTDWPDE